MNKNEPSQLTSHGSTHNVGNDETEQLRYRRVLGLECVDRTQNLRRGIRSKTAAGTGFAYGGEGAQADTKEDHPEREYGGRRVILRRDNLWRLSDPPGWTLAEHDTRTCTATSSAFLTMNASSGTDSSSATSAVVTTTSSLFNP